MTKKQLLSVLTLSALALAQAGLASADEVSPIDPSTPATEQVVTKSPVETPTETPVIPTDPSTPDPSAPTDPVAPTTPEVPVEPSTPSTETPSDGTTDSSDNNTTAPSTPAETPTIPQQPQTDEGNQTSPQEGTVSGATGQVVQTVTPETPVQTNTGASIISTKDGQLILSDGSQVAPEAIGAKTNADKTITVTKADGTKATLPHTGEAASFLSALGIGLLGLVAFLFKKKAI